MGSEHEQTDVGEAAIRPRRLAPNHAGDSPIGALIGSLQGRAGNEAVARAMQLATIQGLRMADLLTALETAPIDVRTDEASALQVGGPRLVTAIRAVAARRSAWEPFQTEHRAELEALPADQVDEIGTYLKLRDIGNSVRSSVHEVPAGQIRAQWPGKKQEFVAAACDPSNQLNAHQLYQIWLRYWMDEQAVAHAVFEPLDHAIRTSDLTYLERRHKFDAGVRGVFSAEYEAAAEEKAATDYYTSNLIGVLDWLEISVDGMHKHLTLEQINDHTVALIKSRESHLETVGMMIAIASVPRTRGVTPHPAEPKAGIAAEVPAAPGTARARVTTPELHRMMSVKDRYYIFRTDNADVAANQQIRFVGKNTPRKPSKADEWTETRVSIIRLEAVGKGGPSYGAHGVIIDGNDIHIYPAPVTPGEMPLGTVEGIEFRCDDIPVDKGRYVTQEDLDAVLKKK